MKLVFFSGSGPTVGMDFAEVHDCENMSGLEIDDTAWQLALDNAAMYGVDYDPDAEGDHETVTNGDDIDCTWVDYSPDLHDQFKMGGGSFFDDFEK